jgi:hypothetical protein
MEEKLNLEILSKSKKGLKPGDVFVLKPKGHNYFFGRVIDVDADCGFGGGAILIYIYNSTSDNKNEVPNLDKNELLLAPIMTNRLPWSKGYFENVQHNELTTENVLPVHCFKKPKLNAYYNEKGIKLDKEYKPTGLYGFYSYRSIDDSVSEKLGIPLVP